MVGWDTTGGTVLKEWLSYQLYSRSGISVSGRFHPCRLMRERTLFSFSRRRMVSPACEATAAVGMHNGASRLQHLVVH